MKKKFTFLVLTLLLGVAQNTWGQQLAQWGTSNPSEAFQATSKALNVTTAVASRVGLGVGAGGSRFNSNNWNSNTGYIQVTVTAADGYVLNLKNKPFNISMGSSNTGPNGYVLRSSVDNYATPIQNINTACGSSVHTANNFNLPDLDAYDGLSSITFRIFRSSATACNNSSLAATGTGGFNSLTINGTVEEDGVQVPSLDTIPLSTSSILVDAISPDGNNVIVAYNAENSFGTPSGTYNVGDVITGGGTIIYTGASSDFIHETLNCGTLYHYTAWAYNTSNEYSDGVYASIATLSDTTPPSAESQTFCEGTTVENLTAQGTDLKWYNSNSTYTVLTNETLQAGIYYVSQTLNNCESERTAVEVTINENPIAPIAAEQTFCGIVTTADLQAEINITEDFNVPNNTTYFSPSSQGNVELNFGNWAFTGSGIWSQELNVQTFAVSPVFNDLKAVKFIARADSNSDFSVYKIVNGVETLLQTTPINAVMGYQQYTININEFEEDVQIKFVRNSGGTLICDNITFIIDAISTNWYDTSEGSTVLNDNTPLQTGIYYVSQTVNGCESERTAVNIIVNEIPTAPTVEAQAFCGEAFISDLMLNSSPTLGSVTEGFGTTDQTLSVGEYTFETGVWNVTESPTVILNSGLGYSGVSLALSAGGGVNGTIVSPAFQGLQSLNFYARGAGTATRLLHVFKVVNGVDTLLEEINLDGVNEYTSFTVNVNENLSTRIKLVGAEIGTVWIDEVTFNYNISDDAIIKWYDVSSEGSTLEQNTALQTGIYYVTKTVNGCESERTSVEITVNDIPEVPVVEAQVFCGESTVADLMAQVSGFNWYNSVDDSEVLVESTVLQTQTYYVSQTVNDCESERTAVEITVNLTEAPTAESQVFCGTPTVNDLMAQGSALKWYISSDDTEVLTGETVLQNGTYYVSQTLNNCESERTSVQVTINDIPEQPVALLQAFCGQANVGDLVVDAVEGATVNWYSSFNGVTALSNDTELSTGIYYVAQTINDCQSPLLGVIVIINDIPEAPISENQSFCDEAQVSGLLYSASNDAVIKWYTSVDSIEVLAGTELLQTGNYYVSQTLNDCESERTAIEVIVNEIPSIPVVESQSFCGEINVENLDVLGENLRWYNSIGAIEPLTSDIALQSGIYYVSQFVNNCESLRTGVLITVNEIPEAPIAESQDFCVMSTATVADLTAQGMNLQWYTSDDITAEPLQTNDLLQSGSYYVSQIVNGCESTRTAITVTVNNMPFAPIAENQTFCGTTTIAYLSVTVVNGASARWYASQDDTESLPGYTFIYDGETYYVSQLLNGCESERTAVTVTINSIPLSPIATTSQEYIDGASLNDLTVDGENLVWYDVEGNELESDTLLTNDTTYHVSQTINGCESNTVAITVTEALTTDIFDDNSFSYYPNPVRDILYLSYSEEITSVSVFNLLGQNLKTINTKESKVSLDLSDFPIATYVVKIVSGDKEKIIKVSKK